MADSNTEFLTTNEVATLTRTAPQTWRRYRCQGKGPRYTRIGTKVLYRSSDLQAWLDARTVENTAQP